MCAVVTAVAASSAVTGVEPGDGVELVRAVPNGHGLNIFVHHLRGVAFPGLFYRVVSFPGSHIRYTGKRVVGDNRLDDQVERRNACYWGREFANRILAL